MSDPSAHDHLHAIRQNRAGLRSCIDRVERALAAPGGGRVHTWAKELSAELDDLGRALQVHIETTEAAGGLLDEIVEIAPRLAKRVERSRDDHRSLTELLASARSALPRDEDAVAGARNRTVELLGALVRHRHLGADLVYDAYNVDIEAAD